MTDVEAQTEAGAQGSNSIIVVMPRQKLKKLVQMLASSVEILKSTLESNDQAELKEHHRQSVSPATEGIFNSADDFCKQRKAVGDDQEQERKERRARTTVTSQEEDSRRKAANLKVFEELRAANGISKHMSLDSWRALQYLDWSFYGSRYTVAESRADALPDQQRVPNILCFLLENSKLRLEIQKEIYYSLSRWWWSNGWPYGPNSEQAIRKRGILDMAPWVALIGMRLPEYRNGKEVNKASSADFTHLRILTVLIELPHLGFDSNQYDPQKEGAFWADNVTVGQALDQCYHQGILEEPNTQDIGAYRNHVAKLISAIGLMNLWHFINFRYSRDIDSVEKTRSMRMSELVEYIHDDEDYNNQQPQSHHDSFQCHEMSLELLRKVGKLEIEWTEFMDEHLCLDVEFSTLKIFWFGFSVKANPMYHMGCQKANLVSCHQNNPSHSHIFDELSNTYSLLFRSRKDTYQANIAQYGLLPVPQWLRVCYGGENGTLPNRTAKDMSYFLQPKRARVSDIEFHLAEANNRLPPTQLFVKYDIWGDRLRQLKAYMDGQKPGGIRGLWVDKRDSSQWFTFWAVVIFGSIGLLLSFLGLIVGIVQAVGTFKALY